MSHYFFWFTGITEFKNMSGFTALDWYYQMTSRKTRLVSTHQPGGLVHMSLPPKNSLDQPIVTFIATCLPYVVFQILASLKSGCVYNGVI